MNWQNQPGLASQREAVRRFAQAIGLSEQELRQSQWQPMAFLRPAHPTEAGEDFDWEEQTQQMYRVIAHGGNVWLFWLAYKGKQKGGLIDWTMKPVTHWEPAPPSLRRVPWSIMTYGGKVGEVRLSSTDAQVWRERLEGLPVILRDGTPAKLVAVRLEGSEAFGSLVADAEPLI